MSADISNTQAQSVFPVNRVGKPMGNPLSAIPGGAGQTQSQQTISRGWQTAITKAISTVAPFLVPSPLAEVTRLAANPQIQQWAANTSSKPAKPMVPTLTEMSAPVADESADESPLPVLPAPKNFQQGLQWVTAHVASQGYDTYNQNPVAFDYNLDQQLRSIPKEHRLNQA